MLGLTLETAVETFILAFVTGAAVASVTAVTRLFRRMRHVDRRVGGLTKWARRAGKRIDVPYEEEDQ